MLIGTIIQFRNNRGKIRVAPDQDRKSDVVICRSDCVGFQPHAGAEVSFEVGKNKSGEVHATNVMLRAANRTFVDPDSAQSSPGVMKMLGRQALSR